MGDDAGASRFVAHVERFVRARLLRKDRDLDSVDPPWNVLDVTTEKRDGNWDLVVLFRDDRHPECSFGFRFDDLRKWRELVPEPGPLANICVANFEESVEAGDAGFDALDCEPGDTVWI